MKILIILSCFLALVYSFAQPSINIRACNRRKDLFYKRKYLKSVCVIEGIFSYYVARGKCAENNMNLFIIDNEDVESQFHDAITDLIIGEHPKGVVWINGQRQKMSEAWKITKQDGLYLGTLYNGVDFYTKYRPGNCLQYSAFFSGEFKAIGSPCNVGRWATCEYYGQTEDPPRLDTHDCKHNKDLFYEDEYIKSACIIEQSTNYDQARRLCAKRNMNLLIIEKRCDEVALHEAFENIFPTYPGGSFWINGKRREGSTTWSFYSPSQIKLGNVYEKIEFVESNNVWGISSGDCLSFTAKHGTYQAKGESCTNIQYAICEYRK